MSQPYLNEAQVECLLKFAKESSGRSGPRVTRVTYGLAASEDLAARERATAMLRALQAQDWASVSRHSALAGTNDLLLGILLHVETEGGTVSNHWVAMRSPFDLMDRPSIVAAGKVDLLPAMELADLFKLEDKSQVR